MTKTEIIQRVAYSIVPNGTRLVEVRPPAFDGTDATGVLSRFTAGNMGGIEIVMARIIDEALSASLSELSDTPDATLFCRLHDACIMNTKHTIQALTIEALEDAVINDHRKMVATIAEIAKELGIEYETPNDRFVQ
jgi:hypothetical protein